VPRLGWFFEVRGFRVYFATDYGRAAALLDECHKHVGGLIPLAIGDISASAPAAATVFGKLFSDLAASTTEPPAHSPCVQ